MPNTFHDLYNGHNVHALTANPDDSVTGYADIAARDADTDFNTNALNINKVVRVAAPVIEMFFLLSVGPTVWSEGFLGTGAIDSPPVVIASLFEAQVDLIIYDGWVAQEDVTITKGSLFAGDAPVGSDMIVDILIDGVAQTRLLTLTDGQNHELTDITDLEVVAGERIGLKFTQAGSIDPGNAVIVTLYQVKT